MFAKLTSTNLTSNRVSRQEWPGLRPESMLRGAPAHANDNRVTRQGSAEARKRPALTCRWVTTAGGRLECRWLLVDDEATREPDGAVRRTKKPVAFGGPRVALVTD
jgi:hypothetical protein